MHMLKEPFENRSGKLFIDGVPAEKLAEEFGTPLYVMSEERIRTNYRRLRKAFSAHYEKIRIYYAAKTNTNISVLKILADEGAHVDAVSPGEVSLALKAGFAADKILFTGTSVRTDELEFLAARAIAVNADSLSPLERLLGIKTPELFSARINPEVGAGHHSHVVTAGKETKFGLWQDDAVKAYGLAKKAGVRRFGIHMHIGAGVLETEPFLLALDKLLGIAKKIRVETGVEFEFVDMGGGLGVPYKPGEKELDLAVFSQKILSLFKKRAAEYGLGEPVFCLEPGRYLVCDAGALLAAVNTVKTTPFKKFIGVDAGLNTLIRPALYGSYHHILSAGKLDLPDTQTCDVVGQICESGDVLARDRRLPEIAEGDLLAVLNAGAYGFSMSSQYNSRPRAAEVLVRNGGYELIRERETLEDLLARQRIARWLK